MEDFLGKLRRREKKKKDLYRRVENNEIVTKKEMKKYKELKGMNRRSAMRNAIAKTLGIGVFPGIAFFALLNAIGVSIFPIFPIILGKVCLLISLFIIFTMIIFKKKKYKIMSNIYIKYVWYLNIFLCIGILPWAYYSSDLFSYSVIIYTFISTFIVYILGNSKQKEEKYLYKKIESEEESFENNEVKNNEEIIGEVESDKKLTKKEMDRQNKIVMVFTKLAFIGMLPGFIIFTLLAEIGGHIFPFFPGLLLIVCLAISLIIILIMYLINQKIYKVESNYVNDVWYLNMFFCSGICAILIVILSHHLYIASYQFAILSIVISIYMVISILTVYILGNPKKKENDN